MRLSSNCYLRLSTGFSCQNFIKWENHFLGKSQKSTLVAKKVWTTICLLFNFHQCLIFISTNTALTPVGSPPSVCKSTKDATSASGAYVKSICYVCSSPKNYGDANSFCTANNMRIYDDTVLCRIEASYKYLYSNRTWAELCWAYLCASSRYKLLWRYKFRYRESFCWPGRLQGIKLFLLWIYSW